MNLAVVHTMATFHLMLLQVLTCLNDLFIKMLFWLSNKFNFNSNLFGVIVLKFFLLKEMYIFTCSNKFKHFSVNFLIFFLNLQCTTVLNIFK